GGCGRRVGSPVPYDAYGITTLVLGSGGCKSAGLTPTTGIPNMVVFTAASNGCTSPLYQFWLLPPGGAWAVQESYGPSTTWSWNTTGIALGTYQVGVWAKAAGSAAAYDAYFITTFSLDVDHCTAAGTSANPASPEAAGTAITFTATATDCLAPNYQFWVLPPPGTTWSVAQPYGGGTTFTWSTTGLANGP